MWIRAFWRGAGCAGAKLRRLAGLAHKAQGRSDGVRQGQARLTALCLAKVTSATSFCGYGVTRVGWLDGS
jgi:hypothetical protein